MLCFSYEHYQFILTKQELKDCEFRWFEQFALPLKNKDNLIYGENKIELDLQSAGSSPNLTYTKLSACDAIMK